jgi:hypothetical protein
LDWANAALKRSATVKVVLVGSGRDLTAASPPDQDLAMNRAVQEHLMLGLTPAQANRVKFFTPASGIIHTKATVVDDLWAILGSANCMRRSLYTDIEHSAVFMDEAGSAVSGFRRKLWGRFFAAADLDVPRANPIDIWFGATAPSGLGARATSGFPEPGAQNDVNLNLFFDVDSRRDWPVFAPIGRPIDAINWPEVKRHDTGSFVQTVQLLLLKQGISVGSFGPDGSFGNDTATAVTNFRAAHGLPSGETVDADVWPSLVVPLRRGANEALVGSVQQHLIDQGVALSRDNDFGSRTQIAIMDLQSKMDLPANGDLDELSWRALVGS